jgi:sugar/nucleoside kinase (ribokinase family)
MSNRYDVYAIGNAIVDNEIQIDDGFLAATGLEKGLMTLASADEQSAVLEGLAGRPQHSAAGGSAANTAVGVAQFGGTTLFIGRVGNDASGALYRDSLAKAGVEFGVAGTSSSPTGACLVLVTPDGERTMQTSLGAAAEINADDVDVERIGQSQVLYVEGYLFGAPNAAQAADKAMKAARDAGVRISLTLSDPGMAEHFIDEFKRVTKEYVDILFCNEHEARIYAGGGTREEVLRTIGNDCRLVFMTCGADGSLVHDNGRILSVDGFSVPVVDTTGAGDMYAAGALYGITHGMEPADAGKLGSFASAKVVSQMGPRLSEALADRIPQILAGAKPV